MNIDRTAKRKGQQSSNGETQALYQGFAWAFLRAPLLPVQEYLKLASEEALRSLLADDRVKAALAIGSTSLLSAIDRFQVGVLNKRDTERMHSKLRRYLIRMSTRPTPYGLFAGVALVPIGEKTELRLDEAFGRSRTRPDMGWLMELVFRLESDPEIRKQFRWVANSAAFVQAGRVFIDKTMAAPASGGSRPVSVRATQPAVRALELATAPIPYQQLVTELLHSLPRATLEKVERLLSQLFEQTFFFTDLRPSLTAASPGEYVLQKLCGLNEENETASELRRLLTAISSWDDATISQKPQAFSSLLKAVGLPPDGSKPIPVQADLKLLATGSLGKIVSQVAGEAAELLLRVSAYPGGQAALIAYRQAFLNRYGDHREVSLLELLDSHWGLGPLGSRGYAHIGPAPARAAECARVLTDLACSCLHKHQRVVELDSELLRQLETCDPSLTNAPVSFDINVQIGALSVADIDSGNFILVVGPNLGAQAAGRNLGRFADLLGPNADSLLQQICSAEARHEPGALDAEIVYLPSNRRMANVVIRPVVTTHEVVAGLTAGVQPSHVIPLHELAVGVEENRFYVRWVRENKRVRFRTGHMLNYFNASPVISFLSQVSADGRMTFTSFDWGPVGTFPFLPRVQKGRIVLAPAQWQIQKAVCSAETAPAFEQWLGRWRAEWEVPRHVCLSAGDNRLILDLEDEKESAELRAEVQKLHTGGALVLQEVIPAFDDAWLDGPAGRHFNEFVLSFVLRPPAGGASADQPSRAVSLASEPRQDRTHAPGGNWLFVKLYCPRHLEDDLIADALLPFAEEIVKAGLADSWFFVRYSDPERHIRLRFHRTSDQSVGVLFSKVTDWAGAWLEHGTISKFVFDTYEQEVERYGGAGGMQTAEELFAADSVASAALLNLLKTGTWSHDETTLLAMSIDDLLDGLGLTEPERLAWYQKQTNSRTAEIGAEYRKRKDTLRQAISDPAAFVSGLRCANELMEIWNRRHAALEQVGQRIVQLQAHHSLSRTLDELCSSFVHLHLNRLATSQSIGETQILGLLQRTRESLRSAPVRKERAFQSSVGQA